MPPTSPTGWRAQSIRTTRSGRRPCRLPAGGRVDAARLAVEHLEEGRPGRKRIGIEPSFLPADAYEILESGLGVPELANATPMMERMRAIKTPAELDKLRTASELITDSMLAVFKAAGRGQLQGRHRRSASARGNGPGPAVRICVDHAWRQPQPGRFATALAGRGKSCRSTRAAITRAISATSAAWRCWANPTPNCRICWPKSRRCSRRRSQGAKAGRRGGDLIADAKRVLKARSERGLHGLLRAMAWA